MPKPIGGGNSGPKPKWWIVLTSPGGPNTTGGELDLHYRQSVNAPAKTGDVYAIFGPWDTNAEAQNAWNNNTYLTKPVGKIGDSPFKPGTNPGPFGGFPTTGNLVQGLFSGATSRAFVVRLVEGLLGGAIIIVAVAKIGGNSKIGQAATKAGKAVKIL